MVGLPKVKDGFIALWVIMDRLTKLAHFILVRDNISTNQLRQIYVRKTVKLHRVLKKIMSNKDIQLVSVFCQGLQNALGT